MSIKTTGRCHCNECGQATKHSTLFQKDVTHIPPPYTADDGLYFIDSHNLAECCGCGAITLEVRSWFSEDDDNLSETHYPPRIARKRPPWLYELPPEYFPLISEVYAALNGGSRILAMMGARTVLDTFIVNKVGDQKNFKNGLDALVKNNYLAEMNRSVIEAAIEAGNASAHRAYNPTPKIMSDVMDIVENLIQHDVLLASAEALAKDIPARHRSEKHAMEGAGQ